MSKISSAMSRKKNKIVGLFLTLIMCGGCAEILEKSVTNKQVELSAPYNNLVTTDSIQTFYWQPVDGADSYQLQVVSPNFDSIAKLIVDTTIHSNIFPLTMSMGQYQWRVRAFNGSSTTSFTVQQSLTIQ